MISYRLKINIYIKQLITVFLCTLFIAATAQASNVSAQLAKLLSSYSTYKANFIQVTYNQKGRVVERNKGSVALRHPRQFRWHTTYPTEQVLIANGTVLWIYDIDLQQATERKFNAENSRVADLLSGHSEKVISQYQIQKIKSTSKTQAFRLLPLAKNKKQALFQSVEIEFKRGRIESLVINNNLDEHTKIIFSKIVLNSKLPGSLFNFKAPPGVDVLTEK